VSGESRLWSVLLGAFGFAFIAFAVALVVVARGNASVDVLPDAAATAMIEASLGDAGPAEDAGVEADAGAEADAATSAEVDAAAPEAPDAAVAEAPPSATPVVATAPKVTHTKAKTKSRTRTHHRR
jgi:hypothetical protein